MGAFFNALGSTVMFENLVQNLGLSALSLQGFGPLLLVAGGVVALWRVLARLRRREPEMAPEQLLRMNGLLDDKDTLR